MSTRAVTLFRENKDITVYTIVLWFPFTQTSPQRCNAEQPKSQRRKNVCNDSTSPMQGFTQQVSEVQHKVKNFFLLLLAPLPKSTIAKPT